MDDCLARQVWADVNSALAATLAKVTLASIMRRGKGAAKSLDYCI